MIKCIFLQLLRWSCDFFLLSIMSYVNFLIFAEFELLVYVPCNEVIFFIKSLFWRLIVTLLAYWVGNCLFAYAFLLANFLYMSCESDYLKRFSFYLLYRYNDLASNIFSINKYLGWFCVFVSVRFVWVYSRGQSSFHSWEHWL